ncbi:unnamed protein product [Peronospora belbahrii]|uniref:60S acidic ribosomal protein P2 n=1 Tax=Peronospora belbahrii TaxID=622444 RepID=A0AAU9KNF5_9STRA|nr:unnamed protein product [Peronospora belbahrii]
MTGGELLAMITLISSTSGLDRNPAHLNLKVIQDALHCCLLACCIGCITALLKAMEGKNIEEVIAAGSKKLASFGAAGAAPAAAAAGAGAAAGGGASAAKVVEKVVEEEEEIDMGGGMDMFGGEEDY